MARHFRRLIFWTIGAIVALVVLALLAVGVLFLVVDADSFRTRIETTATEALGRPVQLSGGLHWHLGWQIQLESRGGEIANAPGFGPEPFARWSSVRFSLAARPLLRRQIQIDRIEIHGLELSLQRGGTGEVNWQFAARDPARVVPATGTTSGGLQIRIGSLAVRDSSLHYHDAVGGRDWLATPLRADIGLPPDWDVAEWAFRDIALSAHLVGAPLAAPGADVAVDIPALRIAMGAGTLQIPQWRLRWNDTRLRGTLPVVQRQPAAVQGTIEAQIPSLRALLGSVSIATPATRDPTVLGPLALHATMHWNDSAAEVTAIQMQLDDTTLTGRVAVPSLDPPALRFELAADRVAVDRYLPPPDTPGDPLEAWLARLKQLDARGTLKVQAATAAGAAAKELRIDVE